MAGLLTSADVAMMSSTVATILDQSLPLYRKSTASDGYGHTTETWPGTPTHTIACNITKPSATMLQAFAGIIGSQRTVILRVLSSTDILEGDRVVYDGLSWTCQKFLDASSYTVTKEILISVVI